MSLWLKRSRQWNALMIFVIKVESCYCCLVLLPLLLLLSRLKHAITQAKQLNKKVCGNNKRNRSSKFRSYDQGAYSRQIGPLGVDWKIIREQYAFDTHWVCVRVCVYARNISTSLMICTYAKGGIYFCPFLSAPICISVTRLLLSRILFWCRDNHMMIYNYICA